MCGVPLKTFDTFGTRAGDSSGSVDPRELELNKQQRSLAALGAHFISLIKSGRQIDFESSKGRPNRQLSLAIQRVHKQKDIAE